MRYRVVPYDPRWPRVYERERALIAEALGDQVVAIEHFGSTAVPGLHAKPVVDITAAVRRLGPVDDYVAPLGAIGYEWDPDAGDLRRHVFRKRAPARGVAWAHLHVQEWGAPNYLRNLRFRDYLRAHPEVAQEYGALKRRLARRFPHNEGFGYSLGKRAFCAAVLAAAEAEAEVGRVASSE
jgi:GrpB-like predicted nucleotidyltransferase (UPF0157 family)